MAYVLAKEQEEFIDRMVSLGRYNNQSEVVREAIRRMEREENAYLNPAPLAPEDAARIYAPNSKEDRRELAFATAAINAIRKARKK